MIDLSKQIDEWIELHKEEFIHDVMDIVRFPSISKPGENGYAFGSKCKECADAFMELGQKYGFCTENDDYYCASILLKNNKKEDFSGEIGFLGHLDVVPEGDGWDFPPYEPQYLDGFITGRGSGDNKGPTIMSLYAMRCLKELAMPLTHDIRLIAGFNEEAGMKDIDHYVRTHKKLPLATIVCDGGWAMCVGEKGRLSATLSVSMENPNLIELQGGVASNAVPDYAYAIINDIDLSCVRKLEELYSDARFTVVEGQLKIETFGKATHAFHPEDGKNAIYSLLRILSSENLIKGDENKKVIRNLASAFIDDWGTGLSINGEDPVFGKTTCVGGVIKYDGKKIRMSVDSRFAMNPDPQTLASRFMLRCEDLKLNIEDFEISNGYLKDPEDPVLKLLLNVFEKNFDRQLGTYVMGGGTHARKIPNAYAFGPAEMDRVSPFGGQAHGRNETCNVERLLKSLKVYVMAVLEMDKYVE